MIRSVRRSEKFVSFSSREFYIVTQIDRARWLGDGYGEADSRLFKLLRCLRTFTRKSSNIDFFIKLLLKLGYELLLSEMQKNWGVTDLVSEIQYLQGHPIIEKSVFLTRYGSNDRMSKNISNETLQQNFLCQFLYEWVY